MFNKSKKLISLNVEKHNDTPHAIVAGEANGSLFKKVLKKLDKCHYVWTNQEMNKVSEGAGLISATLPVIAFTTLGSILNNAALKPLSRLVGFKGLRCKKRKDKDDEEEDCSAMDDSDAEELDDEESEGEESECEESEGEESEGEESEGEESEVEDENSEDLDDEYCDTDDSDTEESDGEECSNMDDSDTEESDGEEGSNMDDSGDEDYGCKKNVSKKKQNWFGKIWDKVYKNRKQKK